MLSMQLKQYQATIMYTNGTAFTKNIFAETTQQALAMLAEEHWGTVERNLTIQEREGEYHSYIVRDSGYKIGTIRLRIIGSLTVKDGKDESTD
jgi:hypothetical protein